MLTKGHVVACMFQVCTALFLVLWVQPCVWEDGCIEDWECDKVDIKKNRPAGGKTMAFKLNTPRTDIIPSLPSMLSTELATGTKLISSSLTRGVRDRVLHQHQHLTSHVQKRIHGLPEAAGVDHDGPGDRVRLGHFGECSAGVNEAAGPLPYIDKSGS